MADLAAADRGLVLHLIADRENLPLYLLATALGFVSLWAVARLCRSLRGIDGLGLGDAKLLATAGAWLGPLYLAPVVLVGAIGPIGRAVLAPHPSIPWKIMHHQSPGSNRRIAALYGDREPWGLTHFGLCDTVVALEQFGDCSPSRWFASQRSFPVGRLECTATRRLPSVVSRAGPDKAGMIARKCTSRATAIRYCLLSL